MEWKRQDERRGKGERWEKNNRGLRCVQLVITFRCIGYTSRLIIPSQSMQINQYTDSQVLFAFNLSFFSFLCI